ncbi:NKIRAS2-containing [Ictidomys tridecemlineatus]|uniref:Uncharacterized protein n=1 Tax=Ictidomys tridecemlineatus TaxID=43179 RepID=A0A287DFF9_ICTTR|nr:NKIRAS2-containing [Ictidomys tridecemlineatus]
MGKSCKRCMCGQASVGKISILEQLLYGNHVVGSEMTEIQEDTYVGSTEIDREVREQITTVVLGNMCDLQEQRRVDPDMLWKVTVADHHSLLEPFIYLASKMTQPQSKSAFPLSCKNKGSGILGWLKSYHSFFTLPTL